MESGLRLCRAFFAWVLMRKRDTSEGHSSGRLLNLVSDLIDCGHNMVRESGMTFSGKQRLMNSLKLSDLHGAFAV